MKDFDFQPHLSSDVVTLTPLAEEDWAELFAVAADPEIWAVHPAHDRWQEPVFRAFFEQALAGGGAFTVRDTATGAVIGSTRYSAERCKANEIEIGWTFLARSAWGTAANPEMKRLLIDHALLHFDRVVFMVGENNGRSRRAMERIGGQLTDRIYQQAIGDRLVPHVVYTIDRARFAEGPLLNPRKA